MWQPHGVLLPIAHSPTPIKHVGVMHTPRARFVACMPTTPMPLSTPSTQALHVRLLPTAVKVCCDNPLRACRHAVSQPQRVAGENMAKLLATGEEQGRWTRKEVVVKAIMVTKHWCGQAAHQMTMSSVASHRQGGAASFPQQQARPRLLRWAPMPRLIEGRHWAVPRLLHCSSFIALGWAGVLMMI